MKPAGRWWWFTPRGRASLSGVAREVVRQKNEGARLSHVSLAVGQIYEMDVDPLIKARMLRESAAWYRTWAARAGNPSYGTSACSRRQLWTAKPAASSKQRALDGRRFRRSERSSQSPFLNGDTGHHRHCSSSPL
jgi:hypothetical protein